MIRRLALVAVAAGLLLAAFPPGSSGQGEPDAPPRPDPATMEAGRDLYVLGCSSCHGVDGRGARGPDGSERGPSLERAGEAAAYYYLSTGRMPLADSDDQPRRKERVYTDEEIDQLVTFVVSISDGPRLPNLEGRFEDLAQGGEHYRENCQACHAASGTGGALSYGRAAPSLGKATPLEIAAAVRAGPGEMPAFGPGVIDDDTLAAIAAYVQYLRDPDDRGGFPIGRVGPVPEGFVAWIVGLTALLAICWWIGGRSTHEAKGEAT